jgi:hypothetical protein
LAYARLAIYLQEVDHHSLSVYKRFSFQYSIVWLDHLSVVV